QEARAIADIYGEDGEFRETVNRYIHDSEAMLRSVLSTRDGHPLAVTLLSSDEGKLYVALAQAIERLRHSSGIRISAPPSSSTQLLERLSRSFALAMTIIFRMRAVRATRGFLPRA